MSRDIGAYLKTKVPFYKTQEAITSLLEKYDIYDIQFTNTIDTITLMFLYPYKKDLKLGVKITLQIPPAKKDKERIQLKNQYYRALFYYLKSKMEAVHFGIRDFGEEFLGDLTLRLNDGTITTIKERLTPQLTQELINGKKGEIKLLPGA